MSMDSAQHQGFNEASGVMVRVGEQLRQFICGLHGHDSLLHFADGRVSLLCSSCGHETPGWDVKSKPVRQAVQTPERRGARLPFVGERRVA
jgi:hypothetical protein